MPRTVRTTSDKQIDTLWYAYINGELGPGGGGGGGIVSIKISPNPDNALINLPNGLYVQDFKISAHSRNALKKYTDGFYVADIPVDNALLSDIDNAVDTINQEIEQKDQEYNARFDSIINSISQIAADNIKHDEHTYESETFSLSVVFNLTNLYTIENVILNAEVLIQNISDSDILEIRMTEQNITTFDFSLNPNEVQKYTLPNTLNFKLYAKGNYKIILYINYI